MRHNRRELSQPLTAVIPPAGPGTRMRSRIPKVLHPICGRPMIDWVLAAVNEAGVRDVTVIANPHHADVAPPLKPARSVLRVLHAKQEAAGPATIASVEDPSRDDGRVVRDTTGALERI